jgi:hypothetical protein
VGDINTYAIFAELAATSTSNDGAAGIIVPTGVATDDTCKQFFGELNRTGRIISLFDFENRNAIFPSVHRSYKFCLLTLSARQDNECEFSFYLTRYEHLRDPLRRFRLTPDDFGILNPNTRTCPIFRTAADAELTLKFHRHARVFLNDQTNRSDWGLYYIRLVHLGDHSKSLRYSWEPAFEGGDQPLYEAKLFSSYDHRFATFEGCTQAQQKSGLPHSLSAENKRDVSLTVQPRYFVSSVLVSELFAKYPGYDRRWLILWRDVARATDERTCIVSLAPRGPASVKCPAIGFSRNLNPCLLFANLNSMVFDYVVRQKVGGISLSFFIVKQLPVLSPTHYRGADTDYITNRVVELVCSADDVASFGEDMGCKRQPFAWNEVRRNELRAELDAYCAHMYGLTRDELRYILDPKDVFGEAFPSETFRVLKEREVKQYGEYRTHRLVLEAYDELAKSDRFRDEMPKRVSAIQVPAKAATSGRD